MTIGVGVWLTIATSFVVLIAAVTFLTWLWFEDRNSESWRRFMLSGRATQSITLMSVLIRWAIGILSAIATSMAASIALEIHGVPMSALAEVSIARFTNSGPQSFKKMLPGTTFRLWLRILMIFLFALVVASQFSSTLLVSDLRELNVLSLKKNLTYGFTFGERNSSEPMDLTPLPLRHVGFDYWKRTPSQSEIFAEFSEPAESSDGLDDTGTVLRAFLPISTKAQRESIQSFNGITRVIDTRVICATLCFGPQLSSDIEHLTITASSTTNSTEPTYSFDLSSNRYNTSAVLKQLGVGGNMASKRQILNISPSILKQSLKDRHQNLTSGGTPGDEKESWLGDVEFPSLAICSSCGSTSISTPDLANVSPLMWQIFNDTLNATNSPALAIQALTTIVWRMAYYDHITSYSEAPFPANVTTFDLAQVPDRQLGFTMLMAIITGNIIIFFVIAFFFLRHIKSSFVENAWHTIAQISQSEEVRPILAKATTETDQNVVRLIQAEESPKGFMGNVKDFFRDVGRMVDQRETKEERLVLKDGVLVGLRSE
ncbi:hypothetical protein H9Q74_001608 [Fusarium xylarioides]|nr:hypothetical protein H9Q71_013171 [Fusarium xylarioides]KAG5828336.1 hypothetical protein H9Q74_001608 [Fusarium xylarioides]